MHDPHRFLATLAMVLGVAALTTVACRRLRLPVIFGYMVAGLLIGPHVPVPVEADLPTVRTLADLGVILLMFTLGLEFSLGRMLQLGAASGLVAVLETSAMFGLGYGAARAFGWPVLEAVYAGAIVSISSTTVIAKTFEEQGVHGRFKSTVFGILVFEDLIAILLLAVLTAVSSGAGVSAGAIVRTVGRLVAFLAGLVTVGMLIVPRAFRAIVRMQRSETTLVASIGLCFATAWLAESLGYSAALGAFLVGALVSESGEGHAVSRLIEPVRDLFVAILFVSVGMLIDPALVRAHAGAVAVLAVLVVVGKVTAVSVSTFLTGHGTRASVQTGMSLAQIGEFSFILAGLGTTTGATREFLFPVAVTVSALTALLTPGLVRVSEGAAAGIDRRLPHPFQTFAALYGSWFDGLRTGRERPGDRARLRRLGGILLIDALVLATIAIGAALEREPAVRALADRTGWSAGRVGPWWVAGAVVLALPFAIGMMRTSRVLGQAVAARVFPAPDRGRLDFAAAPRRALIVMMQLATVLVLGVPLVAVTQPFVPPPAGALALAAAVAVAGIAFWRTATDLQGHARAAAQVVVSALAKQTRAESAGRDPDALARAYRLVPGLGTPVPFTIGPGHHAAGRRLGELRLRGLTDATVLAILRGSDVVLVPTGDEVLRPGDVVALAGTEAAVAAARVLLERGATET